MTIVLIHPHVETDKPYDPVNIITLIGVLEYCSPDNPDNPNRPQAKALLPLMHDK
jgi:hypothetical protein